MSQSGSLQHRRLIRETIEELENEGFTVYNIDNKVPDALAVKNNQLYAVESLIITNIPKEGWESLTVVKKKRLDYSMFDGIIFKVKNRDIIVMSGLDKDPKVLERNAKRIVNDYIRELQLKKKNKIKPIDKIEILDVNK